MMIVKKKHPAGLLMVMLFSFMLSVQVFAYTYPPVWTDPDSGYGVFIDDQADLLTDTEEKSLAEVMSGVAKYCNAVFFTSPVAVTPERICEQYYLANFGSRVNGVMFYIDPEWLYIYSEGEAYDVIGGKWADIITDNVYTYCNPGNYLRCSIDTFTQIHNVLEGKSVPRPMKYICNAILGLLLGFFICYLVVSRMSKLKETGDAELIKASDHSCELSGVTGTLVSSNRIYSPRSSGGHGHGGGHGGGHHGGGGGHRH